jgi:hypothetical protein
MMKQEKEEEMKEELNHKTDNEIEEDESKGINEK